MRGAEDPHTGRTQAQTGLTIIMISSDMPELLGMCDRLMVLKGGKKTGVLERDEFSQEKVLKLAL